jgi:predicted DNA-binding transcriptional regulator AlpA
LQRFHHLLLASELIAVTKGERTMTARKITAMENSPLMPMKEFAALLGVSTCTLWNWVKKGYGPQPRLFGSRQYYFRAEVDTFIANAPIAKAQDVAHASKREEARKAFVANRKAKRQGKASNDAANAAA